MSCAIKFIFGKVNGEEWTDEPFAASDTENPENMETREWCAAEKIAERLKERKMNQLLSVLKTAMYDMKGPLIEGEIKRVQDDARELASKLKEPRRR